MKIKSLAIKTAAKFSLWVQIGSLLSIFTDYSSIITNKIDCLPVYFSLVSCQGQQQLNALEKAS